MTENNKSPENAHALLSPSAAERWFNCPPSVRLENSFPDRESEAAKEGTVAHALGELLIKKHLKMIGKVEYKRALKAITDTTYYDAAMLSHCEDYATFCLSHLAEAKAHGTYVKFGIEDRVDLTEIIPEGFGTLDFWAASDDGILYVDDLKYGKGVPVDVERNKQTMTYAAGKLLDLEMLIDIHTVRLSIFQPRLDNTSTWDISASELRNWAFEKLKPRAELAFSGKGEFEAGTHCKFCRVAGVCKANADFNMQLAQHDFHSPDLLTLDALSEILDKLPTFTPWVKAVQDYCLDKAVTGTKFPGYKLVEGRSNRTYLNEAEIITTLTGAEYTEDQFLNKKLKGVGDMEKLLTKPKFNELLGKFITKPTGAPALVPDYDKRPELNSVEASQNAFSNVDLKEYE